MSAFHYFFKGMKTVFSYNIFGKVVTIFFVIGLIIVCRRILICLQSGGSFFSACKIVNGYLYIHSGIVPGKRKLLLKDMEHVNIHLIKGVHLNGDRYHIELVMRTGRNKAFFVGKSRRNEVEIAELKKLLKKNHVRIHYYDYTKR